MTDRYSISEADPILHSTSLCLGILAVLLIVNLRGVCEAGAVFMVPTCLFLASLGSVTVIGSYLGPLLR